MPAIRIHGHKGFFLDFFKCLLLLFNRIHRGVRSQALRAYYPYCPPKQRRCYRVCNRSGRCKNRRSAGRACASGPPAPSRRQIRPRRTVSSARTETTRRQRRSAPASNSVGASSTMTFASLYAAISFLRRAKITGCVMAFSFVLPSSLANARFARRRRSKLPSSFIIARPNAFCNSVRHVPA